MEFPVKELKRWFLANRRDLPWRESPSPYRVWISEVMLQQTQVSVVIPYFLRWMEKFPTIELLAKAPLEQVIKLWEGLGYYSRARHLHEAAGFLVQRHGGELPSDPKLLQEIKGLGPYTIGAIRSFAFKERSAAVDGNVIRVLSRFFAISAEIDQKVTRKITALAEEMLPEKEPWLVTEGLIELGALICTKEPSCQECPLRDRCTGFRHGLERKLPNKKKRVETTFLRRSLAIVECGGYFLLVKGERGQVMSDLYEFPYLPHEETSFEKLTADFAALLGISLKFQKAYPTEQHSFTRYRVTLFPYHFRAETLHEKGNWVEQDRLHTLPFSSGHKRVLAMLGESR